MRDNLCCYSDVSSDFVREEEEDAGTKEKFWLRRQSDEAKFLFKIGHDSEGNAAEHWAEVAAAELCGKLGVLHAPYELAVYQNQRGTISEDFRYLTFPDGERTPAAFLPANKLLAATLPDYPEKGMRGVKKYTVKACADLLLRLESPGKQRPKAGAGRVHSLRNLFCSYLMLDALIANSDRHHENWGFITAQRKKTAWLQLAPTFDHAASFCRDPAARVRERLDTKDKGRKVEAYCCSPKAKSAFFDESGNPLSPLGAFVEIRRIVPDEAEAWLEKLRKFNPRLDLPFAFSSSCEKDAVAPATREFALQMVEVNRERLLNLPK